MKKCNMKDQVPVLLVEDDEDDICLTRRAFEKGRIMNQLCIVRDGEEAMEYLQHTGRYENADDAPRPGIILLDLNMPRMNGHEVLRQIKSDENLQSIPVIVLTTSDSERDMLDAYEHRANTYITKPVEFDNFLDAVITLGKYWLYIATVPANDDVVAAQPR